jgi:hypothetical protein
VVAMRCSTVVELGLTRLRSSPLSASFILLCIYYHFVPDNGRSDTQREYGYRYRPSALQNVGVSRCFAKGAQCRNGSSSGLWGQPKTCGIIFEFVLERHAYIYKFLRLHLREI